MDIVIQKKKKKNYGRRGYAEGIKARRKEQLRLTWPNTVAGRTQCMKNPRMTQSSIQKYFLGGCQKPPLRLLYILSPQLAQSPHAV